MTISWWIGLDREVVRLRTMQIVPSLATRLKVSLYRVAVRNRE